MSPRTGSSPAAPAVPPALGDRIACARAIAILGMIYVHVPGAEEMIAAGGANGVAAQFLVDGIGRASAALLAIVSGWLVTTALLGARATPSTLIVRRAGTTLRPMVFWAAATVVLYSGVSLVRPTFLSVPADGWFDLTMRFLDTVFFLTPDPIGPTVHLSFLRDLFVCVVLAWPLLRLLRAMPALTLGALGGIYLSQVEIYVVLRPLVLFCFAIGMSLCLYRVRLDTLDRWLPVWVMAGCLATASIVFARSGIEPVEGSTATLLVTVAPGWRIDLLESVLYPLTRLCWTLALWCVTCQLVGRPIAGFLRRQSPWIFTAFCSHFLSLTVLWNLMVMPVLVRLPGASAPWVLFVWFLVAPLLAFGAAFVLMRIIATMSPTLCVLSGVPASFSLMRRGSTRGGTSGTAPAADTPPVDAVPAVLAGGRSRAAEVPEQVPESESVERDRHAAEGTEVREQMVAG